MAVTPKTSWGWVKALLHSLFEQPDRRVENRRYLGLKVSAGPESPSRTPARAPREIQDLTLAAAAAQGADT